MMNARQAGVATATTYFHHPHHQPHHPHHHHNHLHAPQHYHDPGLAAASLAYRPLQLPLQQQQQQQQPPQASPSPAEQQTQLSLAAAGAGPYQHPSSNFRHHQQSTLPHRTRTQARQDQQQRTMSYDQASEDELAALQKASDNYEPEVTGPLVGQRQPSTNITAEYASADPVYQSKTQSLPQKYSHYRTVRGDGKCGWRAVAFGYFEALIHYGDSNKFLMEEGRLRSWHGVMTQAGFNEMLFEDFADETCGLLRELWKLVSEGGDAISLLMERFSDDMAQNYIITHLRTVTAAWMMTREADYAPWLLGKTVEQYCKDDILPVGAEIDNVGLNALKDVLLSPAGISLEVIYLDRSEGGEANMHRFDAVNSPGGPIGFVRLLYRPGHYDLLYKLEDLPAPPPPAAVPTYLQFGSQTHQEPVYDLNVSAMPDFMTMIPGMSYANQSQAWGLSSTYGSASEFSFGAPASVPTCTPTVPTPAAQAIQPQMSSQSVYVPASTPTQLVAPPTQLTHDIPIRGMSQFSHSDFQPQLGGGPFRPSAWQLEPDFVSATSQMPFQTSIFRNSHFNTAHFLNPDFQPEQWDPDGEYATASSSSSKSSRHKNSG